MAAFELLNPFQSYFCIILTPTALACKCSIKMKILLSLGKEVRIIFILRQTGAQK